MFRSPLLVFLLLSAGLATAQTLVPKDVDIVAPDGTKLRATFFAAAKPGPGVLLMHMCNTVRKSWEPREDRRVGVFNERELYRSRAGANLTPTSLREEEQTATYVFQSLAS